MDRTVQTPLFGPSFATSADTAMGALNAAIAKQVLDGKRSVKISFVLTAEMGASTVQGN